MRIWKWLGEEESQFPGQQNYSCLLSKIFARGSLWLMSRATPFSTPWFLDQRILTMEKQHYILKADLEHTHLLGVHCTSRAKCCHLAWHWKWIFRSPIHFRQLLQDCGEMVRPVNSMCLPIHTLHLLWSKFFDQKQYCMEYHEGG